jgi:hypothetical protein
MKPSPKQFTTLIGGDAVVITLFVLLGVSSHDGISLEGWARNAVPLTAAWLVIGGALGVYRTEVAGNLTTILQRTALAWPIAAIIGLVARYLVIGHGLEASFIIVTILINLVMLLLWRTAYAFALRTKRGEASS